MAFWKRDIAEGRHVAEEVAPRGHRRLLFLNRLPRARKVAGLCSQMAQDLRMEAITDRAGDRDAPPTSPETPNRRANEAP